MIADLRIGHRLGQKLLQHTTGILRYLAATPLLGDFLEAGLETLNYSVAELDRLPAG
jgi:hypothetical protein